MPGGGGLALPRLMGGMLAVRHRHDSEHKRQHGEDERLDHADEQLQAVEGDGEDKRREEGEHQDHHLAREHIPEQTECEAHQPHQLRYQLEYADEDVYRSPEELAEAQAEQSPEHPTEVEELAAVRPPPHR